MFPFIRNSVTTFFAQCDYEIKVRFCVAVQVMLYVMQFLEIGAGFFQGLDYLDVSLVVFDFSMACTCVTNIRAVKTICFIALTKSRHPKFRA